MGGQLSLGISLARSKAVDDLADAVIAALLAVKRSDAALFDHLDASFVNVHLTVCKDRQRRDKPKQMRMEGKKKEDRREDIKNKKKEEERLARRCVAYLCTGIPEGSCPITHCRSGCTESR